MINQLVNVWVSRLDTTLFVKDLDSQWRQWRETNTLSRTNPHFLCLVGHEKECLAWLNGRGAEATTVDDLNWSNPFNVGAMPGWTEDCVWMRSDVKFCNPEPSININGFKVPVPMNSKPRNVYYVPDVGNTNFAYATTWTNDPCDHARFSRGLVHSSMSAAVAHAKALLYIDPYKKE